MITRRSDPGIKTVLVAGMELHCLTLNEVGNVIVEQIHDGDPGYVVTMNVDHAVLLRNNPAFRHAYDNATLRVADGVPIVLLGRLNFPCLARVTGADLVPELCRRLAAFGGSIYIIGGLPGSADDAARILVRRYPGLRIAGTSCPEHGFETNPVTNAHELARIKAAKPDVIFAALGTPKQELLLSQWHPDITSGVALGVGAAIDFVSGRQARAPQWMQAAGAEWLYRLAREPRRLWRRYLWQDLPFLRIAAVDVWLWMIAQIPRSLS